jgi:hypothetical protein
MENMTVKQVVDKLQSAIQGLIKAQNYFLEQDFDRKINSTLLKYLLVQIDEDAWALADEVELCEMF